VDSTADLDGILERGSAGHGGLDFQLLTVLLIQIDPHDHVTGHRDQIGIEFHLRVKKGRNGST
jgi:hypothetical protein